MRELSIVLFGIDQPLAGIGISLLGELIQQKLELAMHQPKIVCITDDEGYQFHDGISQLNHAVKNNVMIAKAPFYNQKNQYAELLALIHKKNKEIIVFDMIKTLNLEKMGMMLDACYDLNIPLVSVISRPPAFKTRALSLLKSRFKCFSKPPHVKKLIACIKDLTKHFLKEIESKAELVKYEKCETVIQSEYQDQERYKCHRMPIVERHAILDTLMMNPLGALESIQARDWKYAVGMSYLIGLGTCLPIDTKVESVNETIFDNNLGFGQFFGSLAAQKTLIMAAKEANMENSIDELAVYLECILQFLLTRSFKLQVLFVEYGGLELVSYRSGGLLNHPDAQISKFASMITAILIQIKMYKRRCVTCGDLEKQQGQWETCSRCK